MSHRLVLTLGIIGGLLLGLNRLTTPELTPAQARGDVVGVMLSALLVLVGLLWQQIQPRPAQPVGLEGPAGFELASGLPEGLGKELAWVSSLLLTTTATGSIVVWYDQQVYLRRGVLGPQAAVIPGPILQRVLERQQPVYLVDLALYPGRSEFSYLPPNTQGVICQPLGARGALVLGAHTPRSYTRQEEAWVAALADKLLDSFLTLLPHNE